MPENKQSIEALLDGIEEIVEKMEDTDVSLEDSFSLYENGMKKVKEANELLDELTKKVELLDAEGNPAGSLSLTQGE